MSGSSWQYHVRCTMTRNRPTCAIRWWSFPTIGWWPCRSAEEWSESHATLWWLHRLNGTTSYRFRLSTLSAWIRQTHWQYKWQVWYHHASLILHLAIFASCNGGWFALRKVRFHISLLSLFWVWFWNWRYKVNAFQRYICKNDSKFNLICVSYLRV